MKLRSNLVIVFAVTYLCLLGVLYISTTTVLLEGYQEIETADIQHLVDMGLSALDHRVSDLDLISLGFAVKDDVYSFMQDQDVEHIETILLDAAFLGAKINLMLFVNNDNEILYGKAFDLTEEKEAPIPDGIYEHIYLNQLLTDHQGPDSKVHGILQIPEGLLLINSRPITASQEEAPIEGTLVIGRYLDSSEIEKVREYAGISLEIVDIYEAEEKIDFQSALREISDDNKIAIIRLHKNLIAGYSTVNDIYGDTILVLKVDTSRAIFSLGQTSVWYFLISFLIMGVGIGALAMLATDRVIISRLTKLEDEVSSIDPNTLELGQVEASGDDEISMLATSINGMLDAIRRYRSLLKENERMAAIGETAAMVGHDLRNPLQVIVGSIDLIKKRLNKRGDSSDGREIEKWVDKIDAQTDYMNKIVSDLQDYSRNIKPTREEADVEALMGDVVSSVDIPGDVDVSIVLDEGLPDISVDETLMKRLFTNLILNAVQAMPDGGSLSIRGSLQGDDVVISVEDTGVGIREENLDEIFKPLFTSKAKGTGFGLPVCKRIVDAHGGTISVESEEGVGSTFTVKLPVTHLSREDGAQIPQAELEADVQTDATSS
ncbi:HAMP domain-containing protein [Candidatus Bathyarchaeota archaeon]|nr:MAG: HAMP domain-containing protein [Candidatus Bathyarchaeota archaeon]